MTKLRETVMRGYMVALLLCIGVSAQANQTWTVQYAGTIQRCNFYSTFECTTTPWNTVVTFATVSAANGVYLGGTLPPYSDANTLPIFNDGVWGSGLYGYLAATIEEGVVTGLVGFVLNSDERRSFGGTELAYSFVRPDTVWTGRATMVPEPSTYALMFSGLFALWGLRRGSRQRAGLRAC